MGQVSAGAPYPSHKTLLGGKTRLGGVRCAAAPAGLVPRVVPRGPCSASHPQGGSGWQCAPPPPPLGVPFERGPGGHSWIRAERARGWPWRHATWGGICCMYCTGRRHGQTATPVGSAGWRWCKALTGLERAPPQATGHSPPDKHTPRPMKFCQVGSTPRRQCARRGQATRVELYEGRPGGWRPPPRDATAARIVEGGGAGLETWTMPLKRTSGEREAANWTQCWFFRAQTESDRGTDPVDDTSSTPRHWGHFLTGAPLCCH